jgi:hypothetical protein
MWREGQSVLAGTSISPSVRPSVCLPVDMEQLCAHYTIFFKNNIALKIFRESIDNIQFYILRSVHHGSSFE